MLCAGTEQGPDALYQQHGDALAAEIKAAGGIVTADDLRNASPSMKEPLTIQVSAASRKASSLQDILPQMCTYLVLCIAWGHDSQPLRWQNCVRLSCHNNLLPQCSCIVDVAHGCHAG